MEQLSLLRATTQRLNSTPAEELPRKAGFLASCIAKCAELLRKQDTKTSDASVPVHRLKTRISSLLQDRSTASRFTAAVLIKTLVELDIPDTSGQLESWTRGLLNCLNKPDPYEVKSVYLTCLVRILLVTQEDAALKREITAPLLPSFITTSLNIVKSASLQSEKTTDRIHHPVVALIISAWDKLLQKNGSTFRPFASRIKLLCLSIISERNPPEAIQDAACRVIASLHHCAPKGTASSEWESMVIKVTRAAHEASSQVFRSFLEDWIPNDPSTIESASKLDFSDSPKSIHADEAGLGPWTGLHNGSLRIITLLKLLRHLLDANTDTVSLHIDRILNLTSRLLGVTVPQHLDTKQYPLRPNPEVSRDERDELWANIPFLHIETLKLLSFITKKFDQAIVPVYLIIGNQILNCFEAESFHEDIRSQTYSAISGLLLVNETVCSQLDKNIMQFLCRTCCKDLRPSPLPTIGTTLMADNLVSKSKLPLVELNGSAANRASSPVLASNRNGEAWHLLPLLIRYSSQLDFPQSVRNEMDSTAIVINHQDAMLASVMSPPQALPKQRQTSSIIPFLARTATEDVNIEALLRPRMAVQLQSGPTHVFLNHDTTSLDKLEIENPKLKDSHTQRQESLVVATVINDEDIINGGTDVSNVLATPMETVEEFDHQRKRDFDTMRYEKENTAQKANMEAMDEMVKKPRVLENGNRLLTQPNASETSRNEAGRTTTEPSDSATLSMTAGDSKHVTQPEWLNSGTSSKNTMLSLDQSDSDSEIPEINPELATDDEDEMDD